MKDAYPIRPVTVDEFAAFYAVGQQAFNSHWPAEQARELELATFEPDRSLAAFDGDRIVGTAGAFTFQMAVPGRITGVAGVSWVSVLPSHRRRGILSSLMHRQLADIRDRGEAVAALFSSEAAIYGRYGYGSAAEDLSFTIRRGEGGLLPQHAALGAAGTGGGVRLRIAEPLEPRAELAKIYDSILPSRPGMLARDDRWWDSALADPEFARSGASPLRCLIAEDDAGPRGYALYSVKPTWGEDAIPAGVLGIRELLAADPAAYAAIWADLLTRDLVGEVRARQRPVDDPLLHMLADRRRARPYLTDGLWVRLADLPSALVQRRYACEVDVVIDVTDDLAAGNSGRWRLQAGGPSDPAQATCERTSAAADIMLPVHALGALYLGGTRLGALAGAGQVIELRPGTVAALSAAMSWDPAPWCPVIF
jgi:predicted acetyltransferase